MEMSESAELEKQVNKALELTFQSSNKVLKVLDIINNLVVNRLNNESRERIAKTMTNQNNVLNSPQDITKLKKQISEDS